MSKEIVTIKKTVLDKIGAPFHKVGALYKNMGREAKEFAKGVRGYTDNQAGVAIIAHIPYCRRNSSSRSYENNNWRI